MYSILDYAYNGMVFLNNAFRLKNKKLTSLMLYATTACQSRCKHCNIWQKPITYLSLKDIQQIVKSKCVTKHTTIGLEGGEFLLHPECDKILEWFRDNHPNYTLLSNCLAPKKVIEAVDKYRPKHLYISLDGNKETYKYMRGRDGYDKVMQVVEKCRGKCPISFMFCLSPWNSFEDMKFVINIAQQKNIDVRIGIYGTMDFFETTNKMIKSNDDFIKNIPQNIHKTDENYDFVVLYNEWINGNLKLRCHSIYNELVIHSNGDVPICQNLDVVLGNLHNDTLDNIFNSKKNAKIQCNYSKNCNKCWINYHRKFDIILVRNLEKIFPKKIIQWFYGNYQWTKDINCNYKNYFKSIKTSNK